MTQQLVWVLWAATWAAVQLPPALPQPGGGALAVTVALALALPPVPLQLNVKLEVWLRAPVDLEPVAAWAPLQAPEALQLVALVELQLSVDD